MKISKANGPRSARQSSGKKAEDEGAGKKGGKPVHDADGESTDKSDKGHDEPHQLKSPHKRADSAADAGEKNSDKAGSELLTKDQSALEKRKGKADPPGHQKHSQPPGHAKHKVPPGHSGAAQAPSSVDQSQTASASASPPTPAVTQTQAAATSYSQTSAASYASSSWVRIPYPLSSFVPPSQMPSAPPEQSVSGSESNDDKGDKGEKGDKSDGKKTDDKPTAAAYWYSGFGMTQLRESNVEVLNEAGDAIWKHTKNAPGTRSDTDDL